MNKIKVGINGYGVIGKRIADAVMLQDDMELIGVTARTADYRLYSAIKKNVPIFGADSEACHTLMGGRVPCKGDLNNLLGNVDVVIDCTPAGIGRENKERYDKLKVKSIFQGGEKHELTGCSFVAEANYSEAIGKQSIRVVSCNTTAICRMLNPFVQQGVLGKANMVLARRGSDPVDSHEQGPLGTLKMESSIPSHQGPDAKTILPNLTITTVAFAVPTTLGHLHTAFLELNKEISKDEIVAILKSSPRVVPIRYQDGITAQNQLAELMRDLGRSRADMWEVAFWEDLVHVEGKDVVLSYQVHNEAIVIAENIDAIRAITGLEADALKSIEKTNTSLGILTSFS